jgi:hypothetical protein
MPFYGRTLCNQMDIRLVLLGLVVMSATELVLPFNVGAHRITPLTPTHDPPMLPPVSSKRMQQPQQRGSSA